MNDKKKDNLGNSFEDFFEFFKSLSRFHYKDIRKSPLPISSCYFGSSNKLFFRPFGFSLLEEL